MKKKYACLFHDKCADGLGAAAAVYAVMGSNNVDYFPCNYGEKIPEGLGENYEEIFIVDFSFYIQRLESICTRAKVVHLWDHHKTAWEDLSGLILPDNLDFVYDQDRSGAQITWDFMYDRAVLNGWHDPDGVFYKRAVDLIGDRDLWKWEHGELTKYFHHVVNCEILQIPCSTLDKIKMMTNLICQSASELASTIARGTKYEPLWNAIVKSIADSAIGTAIDTRINDEGVLVPINFAYCPPMFASDVGNAICAKEGEQNKLALLLHWKPEDEGLSVSVRRSKDAPATLIGADELVRVNGGGGHKNAAGCFVNGEDIDFDIYGRWHVDGGF